MKLSEKQKGIVALILLTILFASMGIFARYMQTSFTILQQVYLRIAAALLIAVVIFRKKLNFKKLSRVTKKDWIILTVRSLSMYVFGVVLFTYGIINAKYSNVSFISALPLTAIFGFVLLKEKITFWKIFYVLIAFIGVIFISVADFSNLFSFGQGELATLVSVVFFSFSYIARKWQSKILNNYEITVIIFMISLIVVFASSVFIGEGLPLDNWSYFLLAVVAGAGLFNVGNLFFTNYGFERVKAVLASNLLTLESLFAVVIGFLFFKELSNIKELLGGILIIFSVVQMNKLES